MNLRVSNTGEFAVLAHWSSCHLFLLETEVTCGCLAKGVKSSAVNDLSLSTRQLTPRDMKCDWRHSMVNREKKKSASSFTIFGFDISQQHISDVLTHISVLHNATIGSWSESVSQLQSVSYVMFLSVYIQPYLFLAFSFSLCECGAIFTFFSQLVKR